MTALATDCAYVLLLRGVNVGGKNRLPMQILREVLQNKGYVRVQTYIQSGNAVFWGPQGLNHTDEQAIAQAIQIEQGFQPQVYLRSQDQWQQVLEQSPFALTEGKTVHVYFCAHAPTQPDLAKLEAAQTERERFVLHKTAFYLHTPDGLGRSRLAAGIEKALGVPCTARNGKTVLALDALLHK